MTRLSFYTGPVIVRQIADKLREAGVRVSVEGTEHVHVIHESDGDKLGARLDVLDALRERHGTVFGLK